MKKIAVFTSGGDSPGMNACIRAVVRTAIFHEMEVFGIMRGYEGLIDGEIIELKSHSVANILQRGGTILKSARSQRFMEKEWRAKAAEQLTAKGIEGVVAIGGDGTFRGAEVFSDEHDIPFIGVPGTIDNDMYGTDFTIGYDTAINTVVEVVDKIRDTADSHNRLFFIEVMGRDAGFIALRAGIGSGAEAILVPEEPTSIDRLIEKLERGRRSNKTSGIIMVSEGDDAGGAYEVADKIKARFNEYETRVSILGHLQRGGNPSAMDRVLASTMGNAAVLRLKEGHRNEMVGVIGGKVAYTSFDKAVKHHKEMNQELLTLAETLSI